MKKELRVGVVNWDAGLPNDTYFGNFALQALGYDKYAHRLPYYTIKNADGEYEFPIRTQEQYDQELTYAADAGIDFFMYCWYPDGAMPKCIGEERFDFLADHVPPLNRMRKFYQASPLNKRIKMCAIVISEHAYAKQDFIELVNTMKQDYYEYKDGRPLVFVFGAYRADLLSTLREIASAERLNPYIAFMDNGNLRENCDYPEIDAVSEYSSCHGGENFEELFLADQKDNDDRKKFGLPVIPLLSAGWNPSPRIDRPRDWVKYGNRKYAPAPTGEQMEKATLDFFKWIDNTPQASTGYGVIFAWNEFEEGGYLCPTLGKDGKPHTDILDGLGRALKQR